MFWKCTANPVFITGIPAMRTGFPVMKTGSSLREKLHREKPVFITGMGLQCGKIHACQIQLGSLGIFTGPTEKILTITVYVLSIVVQMRHYKISPHEFVRYKNSNATL